MSEVSSNQTNTNNAATNTGEAPRERGFERPSRPMAPPKRGAIKKKIWEDFTGKPSSSNPPTASSSVWYNMGGRVDFSSLVSMDVVQVPSRNHRKESIIGELLQKGTFGKRNIGPHSLHGYQIEQIKNLSSIPPPCDASLSLEAVMQCFQGVKKQHDNLQLKLSWGLQTSGYGALLTGS